MKQPAFAKQLIAVLMVCVMAAPAWPATPSAPQLPDPGTTSMPKEQQIQLGLKAMAEVYKQMPVLPDSSPITQYVQRLGKQLEAAIPAQYSWPYQFHVIQQKEINAFALPGGPIFINVGTIQAADNEAELAGVMAHEMSHVYMQHSAKQAPKAEWANSIGALGGLFGGSTVGTLARLGIQLGAGSLLMRYSRKDEAQADAVGAIIMYKDNYNPEAMADFFEKLEKQGGGNGPQFLSDHPNPGNRRTAIQREIRPWAPKHYLATSDAFLRVKQESASVKSYTAQQIADGAKSGQWAQQNRQTGAIPANLPVSDNQGTGGAAAPASIQNVSYSQIRPSGNFKRYDHQAFSIVYPDNWQAASDQSSVTIAPPAGVGQGAVAYGVVIGAAQDQNASSMDQATQDLVQNLEQTNPGLRASGGAQSIDVNGMQGRTVNLTGNSPIQENGHPLPERDWLVAVPRGQGGLLYVVFIAPEKDFSQLRSSYQRMLDSLQVK